MGSVGMFLGAFVMILVLTAIFGTGLILPTIVILSLFATIVEALTPKGIDNYTIPLAVLLGIALLSVAAPSLWPYTPLITL